ncbi:MAG TPA: SDR family NAD(P)-dependent oxidoreductase [Actinomycetota bacterium]|nr:SDR family NAD(P)-dependent oxidoreductase [Actinomycetota bacterium]
MSRCVLVTGATGALGTAVTRRFLGAGDNVVASWRREPEAERLAADLGGTGRSLALVRADVTDPASVAALADEAAAAFGPVGVLVHLVGGWRGGEPVHEHSLETWDGVLSLNLRSAFLCCRALLPGMRAAGWGRVVLVSSRTARRGRAGQAAYAVAKAGVAVLAEAIAEETRGMNVTANSIEPSTLDTPANRAAMPNADPSRWVPVEDAAAAIAFLASEEAGQLRGARLPVHGAA